MELEYIDWNDLSPEKRSLAASAVRDLWGVRGDGDEVKVGLAEADVRHTHRKGESSSRYTHKTRLLGWPRFWELFGFCLPRKICEEVDEPGRNELLEDYFLARKYRTKWARRWLTFCFTFRTVLLVADCWRVLLKNGAVKIILGFVPWLR